MLEEKMDDREQCPVCTLYLHSGMSLEIHLDTHPKDQVIKALCSLSVKGNKGDSRTSTPSISERSYRSRTPVTDDSVRWSTSRRSAESNYWRRTPSRNKSFSSCNSRNDTPDVRMNTVSYDGNAVNHGSEFSDCSVKSSKTSQTFLPSAPTIQSNFNQQYPFYSEIAEDPEIKYSRSSDYNVAENTNQLFAYNVPVLTSNVKVQAPTLSAPSTSKKQPNYVKILPKQNMVLKNAGRLGYIPPGIKPYPVMMSTSPSYVQKNIQANMMMAGNVPVSGIIDTKTAVAPIASQFTQINPGNLTTGTTVVTQNSQIIYREMVHSIDGKPYISNIPHVLNTNENIGQSSSMYQNLMVVDPFGNTSCMYNTPQTITPKMCNPPIFSNSLSHISNSIDKSIPNIVNDVNKTLIMEVNPMMGMQDVEVSRTTTSGQTEADKTLHRTIESESDLKNASSVSSKGLKILSNIKVEVPVQHHKNMINTVMDLTGPGDSGYIQRPQSPENILPDLKERILPRSEIENHSQLSNDNNINLIQHSFSVIKNVGNPQSSKDFPAKPNCLQEDNESSDSNPVPDLICNEKPSISPCSELLENSMDRCSPLSKHDQALESNKELIAVCDNRSKTEPSTINQISAKAEGTLKEHLETGDSKTQTTPTVLQPLKKESVLNDENSNTNNFKNKSHPLRLNNIFVKKHKKKLTIKNFKPLQSDSDPLPSSSTSKTEEYFNVNIEKVESKDEEIPLGNSVEKIEVQEKDFDADTEEQSMDIEPTAPSTISHSNAYSSSIELVIKEEINSSNEFSNETDKSGRQLATLETLRPINVITYGNMGAADFDEDSNHRELLDLETASKNKQFVNMINDNYFGDNIYADYFTPDRVESFDSGKESNIGKDREMYNIWGEPSQKENEFVLPNFIHESYKIADSNMDYDIGDNQSHTGHGEQDSKADVLQESRDEEPPLNICADERMPSRGELSGQESNGDMESSWSGMYPEVTGAEPYDLMARESWVSDGSDIDASEKTDNLEEESLSKGRLHTCGQCGLKFPTLKELRSHCNASYSHSRITRCIKKEEKLDVPSLAATLIFESKDTVTTSILPEFDPLMETKPELILIKQKKKRNNFVCLTCKVDQGNYETFNEHLKVHPLECLTCGKLFYRRANLVLHMKIHLGIKNYKCEVCGKRFITGQKLSEHRNVHTGLAPVKCTLCEQTFRRYSNMVQHRDRHHLKKKAKVRDFICHCGAVFQSRGKLQWHQETHDEKPKACPHCGDKFLHAASLTRHVRRSHNNYYLARRPTGRDDNVTCPVCKQVYLRSNLRAHLQTHSGKRPFPCVICNKSFTTKWNLKLHRWTHTSRSAKPFKCTLCNGAFFRQTEFTAHMNAHKSVRPYTCKYCGCQFIRKYNCQRHVKEHETAKKYVCKVPECGKTFHRSYYLSEHMRVHSGARPFACNICGKTSSNKSNHNKHVKIHHAREPVATEA